MCIVHVKQASCATLCDPCPWSATLRTNQFLGLDAIHDSIQSCMHITKGDTMSPQMVACSKLSLKNHMDFKVFDITA